MRMGVITMRMSLDLCTRFKNKSSEEGRILDRACGIWQLRVHQQDHYDSMLEFELVPAATRVLACDYAELYNCRRALEVNFEFVVHF